VDGIERMTVAVRAGLDLWAPNRPVALSVPYSRPLT
jgi:hypothetical protein